MLQRAFRERINHWPKVGERDGHALREFSDFLNSCKDSMQQVKGLQILNDYEENRKMAYKLPDWTRQRWNSVVTFNLKSNSYPSFQQFYDFLEEEAEVACNPLLARHPDSEKQGASTKGRAATGRTFSTQAESQNETLKNDSTLACPICPDKHSLLKCRKFEAMSIEERRKVIIDQRLCFGCLRGGHRSKFCKRRERCIVCHKSHPTLLHVNRVENEGRHATQATQSTSSISCYAVQNSCATSMVVPVWVSDTSSPHKEVLT